MAEVFVVFEMFAVKLGFVNIGLSCQRLRIAAERWNSADIRGITCAQRNEVLIG